MGDHPPISPSPYNTLSAQTVSLLLPPVALPQALCGRRTKLCRPLHSPALPCLAADKARLRRRGASPLPRSWSRRLGRRRDRTTGARRRRWRPVPALSSTDPALPWLDLVLPPAGVAGDGDPRSGDGDGWIRHPLARSAALPAGSVDATACQGEVGVGAPSPVRRRQPWWEASDGVRCVPSSAQGWWRMQEAGDGGDS